MNKLLLITSIVMLYSCTKDSMTFSPVSNQQRIDRSPFASKRVTTSSYSFTYTYNGSSDANFNVSLPAFNIMIGVLKGYKLDISRTITGTIGLSNVMGYENDSSIGISRYCQVTTSNGTVWTIPNTRVRNISSKLSPYQTVTTSINMPLNDSYSSESILPEMYYGVQSQIIWNIRDAILAFKPNCTNTVNLNSNTVVTLTYIYTPN